LDGKALASDLSAEISDREDAEAALQGNIDLKADKASPAFTGIPTAPTASNVVSSTQLATTAFVHALLTELIGTAPANLDTLQELAAQLATDESAVSALTTIVASKLAKASNLSDLTDAAQARLNLGLGSVVNADTTTTANINDSTNKRFVTDAQRTVLGNTSGSNSGDQTLSDATISTTDITTNNVSTSKHGFAPKLPNDASKFLNGVGAYAVPPSGAPSGLTTGQHVVAASPTSIATDGVKRYVALLTQSGTSAPTATVNENSTGVTITPSYVTDGTYRLTASSGIFLANKTHVYPGTVVAPSFHLIAYRISDTVIELVVWNILGEVAEDDRLSNTSLTLLVYP
jgi:hypothetical protein